MLGLAFSGGKDSLACWYLFKKDDPIVIWVNTGKVYPETLRVVEMVKKETSKFIEIKTDQEADLLKNGVPSELVPIDSTALGALFVGGTVLVQSYLACCFTNITIPMFNAAKAAGVTRLIYGQRDDEAYKAPATDGQVVDGIERLQPIQKWSKEDVFTYLKTQMSEIPEHFVLDHSSMDCYDCTAYLSHSKDRVEWTKQRHPELHEKYVRNMTQLKIALAPAIEKVEKCYA